MRSSHVSFANAVSDDALVEFVREFGPVAAKAVAEGDRPQTEAMSLEDMLKADLRTPIAAVQDLVTLRRERRTYASALGLLGELMQGENKASVTAMQQHVAGIAEGVWYWPEQWEAERQWRASQNSVPVAWHFDSNRHGSIFRLKNHMFAPEYPTGTLESAMMTRPFHAGHLVLCRLINAFATEVRYFNDRAVEALPFDSLRFGIRPALYQILKHMYLGRAGAQVCRNDQCRQFFESKREGQNYCRHECSQQYRQRQYWAKTGAKKRKSRRRLKQKLRRKKSAKR